MGKAESTPGRSEQREGEPSKPRIITLPSPILKDDDAQDALIMKMLDSFDPRFVSARIAAIKGSERTNWDRSISKKISRRLSGLEYVTYNTPITTEFLNNVNVRPDGFIIVDPMVGDGGYRLWKMIEKCPGYNPVLLAAFVTPPDQLGDPHGKFKHYVGNVMRRVNVVDKGWTPEFAFTVMPHLKGALVFDDDVATAWREHPYDLEYKKINLATDNIKEAAANAFFFMQGFLPKT